MELQILLYVFSNMSLASRAQRKPHQSWKCEMRWISDSEFSDVLIGCIFLTYIICCWRIELQCSL